MIEHDISRSMFVDPQIAAIAIETYQCRSPSYTSIRAPSRGSNEAMSAGFDVQE